MTDYVRFILFTARSTRADNQSVTFWFALFLAQDTRSQADRIRAAMEASLASSSASVQKQAQTAGASMTPWTPPNASQPVEKASIMFQPLCDPIAQPQLSS